MIVYETDTGSFAEEVLKASVANLKCDVIGFYPIVKFYYCATQQELEWIRMLQQRGENCCVLLHGVCYTCMDAYGNQEQDVLVLQCLEKYLLKEGLICPVEPAPKMEYTVIRPGRK